MTPEPAEPVTTVGLSERVDPANAPRPANDSERLFFRQLYETLVRVDCTGRVLPGLADSWRFEASARIWILTLREHARFMDGTPLTAADVQSSWTRNGDLRPDVSRLVDTIAPVDDRTVAITLRTPQADAPVALAHTDLAIAKEAADSPWPLGTRGSRVVPGADRAASATSSITVERDGLPSIQFLVAPGDPRDLLDAGLDLLVTRDPATLAYAATLGRFQDVPLAWQRTYVLLTPGRRRMAPLLSPDARQALAKDAVRGEARGAEGPFWWETLSDCGPLQPRADVQGAPIPRIVYGAGDPPARDLAERLVGLARASSAPATPLLDALLPDRARHPIERATALSDTALARARRVGRDAGYLESLDRRPLDPCREWRRLTDEARWIDPATIVPLVDTRQRALVRIGRSGVAAEFDGGLVLAAMDGRRDRP